MSKQLCFRAKKLDVHLIQTEFDSFTVIYGKSVKSCLSYAHAALELGSSIMHAVACDGRLDSRTKAEARRGSSDRSPYFSNQHPADH